MLTKLSNTICEGVILAGTMEWQPKYFRGTPRAFGYTSDTAAAGFVPKKLVLDLQRAETGLYYASIPECPSGTHNRDLTLIFLLSNIVYK